jgi:hypothetical protein
LVFFCEKLNIIIANKIAFEIIENGMKINGNEYTVLYRSEMKDKWDSCIIQACEYGTKVLEVLPGDPSWRHTIVD